MIHMHVLNLSIKSQDLWLSLYGLQVKMRAASEVNFTDTVLLQTKGHWAVTEKLSKEKKMMPNASGWPRINLGKHQHVVCFTHVYTCMFILQ